MEQLTLWNLPIFKIDKPIRLIELFAGIGAQSKALERLGADFEHYRVCEFDPHAIKSYNAIHGTNFETSDVTQITAKDLGIVDTNLFTYLLTYSFPCQDLSTAGKQRGMAKGMNTRSSLLWEVERLLNECTNLPQVLLMENVPNIHGLANMEHFKEWIRFLESKGYSNYWKDLNAKDFGIPQNRPRTFMVSILGEYDYKFPQEIPLKKRLKDLLEDEVDEKFYLSDAMKNYILDWKDTQKGTQWDGRADNDVLNPNIAHTLSVRGASGSQRAGVSNFILDNFDGEIKVKDIKALIKYKAQKFNTDKLVCEQRCDRGLVFYDGDYCGALRTIEACGDKRVIEMASSIEDLRIRKLIPLECFRLQDFDDEDFEKASKVNSNAQLWKQAGNSICVACLYYIFKQML